MTSSRRYTFLAFLPLLALACGDSGSDGAGGPKASLRRFASEEELTTYLKDADVSAKAKNGGGGGAMDAGAAMGEGDSMGSSPSEGSSSSGAAPPNETITNNQEEGVDEGGIVKNIGSSLVVLRKGRLYAVSVATSGAPHQTDSVAVAPTDALNQNVWYDEMLVRGDRIYVVGYRYGLALADEGGSGSGKSAGSWHGATEVSSFRLTGDKLERLKTLYLESNDYFSGSNYTSRMIDGKLTFYMPHGAWAWNYASSGPTAEKSLHIPTYFTSRGDGTFDKGAPIFTPTDVYVPIDVPTNPIFHTVVKCELPETGDFACTARSLLSDYGREHYVTPDAVFLWSLPRAYMFRFEDLGVVAHKSAVTPRDQFSFKEKDGVLHILGSEWHDPYLASPLGTSGSGADSATPVYTPPKLVVESLPLSAFDAIGDQTLDTEERIVDVATNTYVTANRFVGGAVFLGVGPGWSNSEAPASKAKIVRFDLASGATASREVSGSVNRIESLGESRAFIAVQGEKALDLESLSVDGDLASRGNAHLDGLAQGESRSQGFFFKPKADGTGTFGLPVMNASGGEAWYGSGLSNIGFWNVDANGGFGGLGIISSSNETGACETSCVDWYGNTRPIFLGDRAFALMGSELAEITLAGTATRLGAPAVLSK